MIWFRYFELVYLNFRLNAHVMQAMILAMDTCRGYTPLTRSLGTRLFFMNRWKQFWTGIFLASALLFGIS